MKVDTTLFDDRATVSIYPAIGGVLMQFETGDPMRVVGRLVLSWPEVFHLTSELLAQAGRAQVGVRQA